MKASISEKLVEIRKRLTEADDAAWGPDSEVSGDAAEGEAGEGGAENVSDVGDVFDAYVLSIVGSILDEYEMDEEEAVSVFFDVAASLEEDGSLPEIPDEGDEQATAEWVGAAKMMGFGDLVLATLEAEEEESDEEESEEE